MLFVWEPVQTGQCLKLIEGESLRFDCTYMTLPRKVVDSILDIPPIRTANLRGYLKFPPPNTNRIAGFGDEDDINNSNFSGVAVTSLVLRVRI